MLCWWCPYRKQTWEHVFAESPTGKEDGRGKDRYKIQDPLDTRCSKPVLDFGCGKAGLG